MIVSLPYGAETARFTLPDDADVEVLSPAAVCPAQTAEEIIRAALDAPIGSVRLEQMVGPGQTVNILCDDISRPTPVDKILPLVIERLLAGGVRAQDIKIIIALGSHRYMTEDELRAKVGDSVFENYAVENSEFWGRDKLVDLGLSPDGCRVLASKNAMSSEIRIGIGNIVPHNIMGWSGGAKILYPGISGEETVAHFHLLAGLQDENMFGSDDCVIRRNVEAWVENIGLHFIANTILTGSSDVYKMVAGHYVQAHRQGVAEAKRVWGVHARRPADVVIVSSHPADQDLWQSAKAFFAAEHALRASGGTIINVSPNLEGGGPHAEYPGVIGDDAAETILQAVSQGAPYDGDPLALSIGTLVSKMRKRRRLVYVGDGLDEETIRRTHLPCFPLSMLQSVVDTELGRFRNPVVTVITHGGELMVYHT